MYADHDEFCNQAIGKWDGGCQCEKIAEIRADERKYVMSVIEELPCLCDEGKDYCDGQTDAIDAIDSIDSIDKVADERAKYVLPDLPKGGEHVDWCRDLACYGCVEVTE
jgi:hypothetical protein